MWAPTRKGFRRDICRGSLSGAGEEGLNRTARLMEKLIFKYCIVLTLVLRYQTPLKERCFMHTQSYRKL